MATVTGVTKQYADTISDQLIEDAERQGTSLVFKTKGGTVINVPNAFPKLFESFPIGSIYMSALPANPTTYLEGGTWVRWGKGRVPVGVDENDVDFDAPSKEAGEKRVTLTKAEMPSHNHGWTANAGGVNQTFTANDSILAARAGSGANVFYSDASGGAIGSTGGSQSHNNLQPYITVYMWKRTA